ncbi:MAG TPA: GDSL-type esterase/lipase family protein [Acidimicrobiales bacterium]|jgi:lysophospholipase L1-like esterase|nr:GDSL-type esterase/lipase family protein [Acidimicrobiales bacterium]
MCGKDMCGAGWKAEHQRARCTKTWRLSSKGIAAGGSARTILPARPLLSARTILSAKTIRSASAVLAATVLAAVGSLTIAGSTPASATTTATTATTGPIYQLSLGDSLAAGVGASTPANDYVNLVAAHEQAAMPGLQVENLSCGGATTDTMLNGGGACVYTSGTQLGDAEAFLQAHPGQVRYITIDIGANDVDNCLTGGSISLTCIETGLGTISSNLPQIVSGLEQAASSVPIFGMDYYDPFLQQWVTGTSGQQLATESAQLSSVLNGDLTRIYGSLGANPVDVQGPFAVQDFAMTGSFQGTTVPENVSRTCAWTHMCDPVAGGGFAMNIHTNDIGHTKLAGAFEQTVDRWFRGGGQGQWLATANGKVITVGNAVSYGSMAGKPLNQPIVGMATTPDGKGYWLVASDGGVFTFGDATFFGSEGGQPLNQPIVGIAATPEGQGYWLVAADGGIFTFGDAPFLGSEGGQPLSAPVVGIGASTSGLGYWLVGSDGAIYPFGDAGNSGSEAGQPLNQPIVGMAVTVDGNGYWMVARDGGVFSFGDAGFHGSAGGIVLNKPVIGMSVAPNGFGYWLVASDGGIFTYGSASFNGSRGGHPPPSPVVAVGTT